MHELDYHRKKHFKEVTYVCSLCPESKNQDRIYRYRDQLAYHLRHTHTNTPELAEIEIEKLWKYRNRLLAKTGLAAYN